MTREGIMTLPHEVEALKNIAVPTTKKQSQSFIGLINYYIDIWRHRSGGSKECQKTYDTIEKLVSRETLLSYPNFNKPFVIHMDASKLQLGAVIS